MRLDGTNENEKQEHIVVGQIEATLHCGTCAKICVLVDSNR